MKYLDLTLPTPAENLACDEALLVAADRTGDSAVLRFYELPTVCVVVGYGNRVEAEVDRVACARERVPVLRRVSGGGTVLLGPGCLAYSLVLPIASDAAWATVTGTNRGVMERQRAAIESVAGRAIGVGGHTDLILGTRKFGGSAQRRARRALLFHGTLLLDFDLARIGRLLPMPSREPEYRQGRDHSAFLVNLGVEAVRVREALRLAWGATEPWTESLEAPVAQLMAERYGREEWHARR